MSDEISEQSARQTESSLESKQNLNVDGASQDKETDMKLTSSLDDVGLENTNSEDMDLEKNEEKRCTSNDEDLPTQQGNQNSLEKDEPSKAQEDNPQPNIQSPSEAQLNTELEKEAMSSEGVEKELVVEDNDKTPDQDMLSGAFDFFSAPRRTDDKITRFLMKKANWDSREITLVPEVQNWDHPPESAQLIRGLWSGVDEDLFKKLEEDNWTILPFRSVMVWDLKNDAPPRALKEDLKLLWTRKWDGTVKQTQYKHDPETQPEWENIKICNSNNDALSETVLVKRPGVHWIFGLKPIVPNGDEEKLAQRLALAHAMKDARTHKYFVVVSTDNPESKLQKGARWGTEWLALKGKLKFWDKVAISWIKFRLKKDKKNRKKLFDQFSPHA